MTRGFAGLSLSGLMLVLVGCGEPTGTVTGTVTLGGTPIPAQVTFVGDNGSASGTSDASGSDQLYGGDKRPRCPWAAIRSKCTRHPNRLLNRPVLNIRR